MKDSSEYGGWAYLKLTSQEPLTAICEHVGSSGDSRSWSIGDRSRNGIPAKCSGWILDSGLQKGEPLDAHIKALWKRIGNVRPAICSLPEEITRVLQCVGHFKDHNDACALSSGHFATAAFYHLDWDFDFYFDNEFGHEVEGKPYWEW
ncbi:MAG: DUF4279 domain-containing protein [Octadecabacter sp.]